MQNPHFIPLVMEHAETKEYLGHIFLLEVPIGNEKYLLITDMNFIKKFRGKNFRGSYVHEKFCNDIYKIVHQYAQEGGYKNVFQSGTTEAISNENGLRRMILRGIESSDTKKIEHLSDLAPNYDFKKSEQDPKKILFPDTNMMPIVMIPKNI